jgi:hypothetical protein
MLIKLRLRFPEVFFGALLAVALFALGATFWSSQYSGQTTQTQSAKERAEEKSTGQPNEGLWHWLTHDAGGFFTAWLVIVGGGQLALFYVQLKLIRESLVDTKEAADAAQGAANAAEKQAKIAERSLTELQRAFVFIDGFNIELTTALDSDLTPTNYQWLPTRYQQDPGLYVSRFAAQPRWKNGGNTPTEQLTIQVHWRALAPPNPPPNYTYREAPRPFFLAPQAVEPSDYIEMPSVQGLIDWASNPVGVPPVVLIWGRADYLDIFGNPHFVEWCYQLRFARPRRNDRMTADFIQWGDYNRTDNYKKTS